MAKGLARGVTRGLKGLFIKAVGALALLRLRCHSFVQEVWSCNISACPRGKADFIQSKSTLS